MKTLTIGVILLIAIIEHSTATLDEQLRNYANKFMSSGKDFCKPVLENSTDEIACSPFAASVLLEEIRKINSSRLTTKDLDFSGIIYKYTEKADNSYLPQVSIAQDRTFKFYYHDIIRTITQEKKFNSTIKTVSDQVNWRTNIYVKCEIETYGEVYKGIYITDIGAQFNSNNSVKMVAVKMRDVKITTGDEIDSVHAVIPCKSSIGEISIYFLKKHARLMPDKYFMLPAAFKIGSTISLTPYLKKNGMNIAGVDDIIQNIVIDVTSSASNTTDLPKERDIVIADHPITISVPVRTEYTLPPYKLEIPSIFIMVNTELPISKF